MVINLHRPIPDGFGVKQVQIVKKASGWYAVLCIQSDVNIPAPKPVRVREALRSKGKFLGIDLGLEKFIATSQGELMARPQFFVELQSQLKWLQRRLSKKQKVIGDVPKKISRASRRSRKAS